LDWNGLATSEVLAVAQRDNHNECFSPAAPRNTKDFFERPDLFSGFDLHPSLRNAGTQESNSEFQNFDCLPQRSRRSQSQNECSPCSASARRLTFRSVRAVILNICRTRRGFGRSDGFVFPFLE